MDLSGSEPIATGFAADRGPLSPFQAEALALGRARRALGAQPVQVPSQQQETDVFEPLLGASEPATSSTSLAVPRQPARTHTEAQHCNAGQGGQSCYICEIDRDRDSRKGRAVAQGLSVSSSVSLRGHELPSSRVAPDKGLLQAEAAALARAHRALRRPSWRSAADELSSTTTNCCPLCGSRPGRGTREPSKENRDALGEGLDARLAVLEELLTKTVPLAMEANRLRQDLAEAEARSVDLERGLLEARSVCEELLSGLSAQTLDFERFTFAVRQASGQFLHSGGQLEAVVDSMATVACALNVRQRGSIRAQGERNMAAMVEVKRRLTEEHSEELAEEKRKLHLSKTKSRRASAEQHSAAEQNSALVEALQARIGEERASLDEARHESEMFAQSHAESKTSRTLAQEELVRCRSEMDEFQSQISRTSRELDLRGSELLQARQSEIEAAQAATKHQVTSEAAESSAETASKQLKEDKAARASLRMERSAAPAASGERHGSRALDALCKGDVMSKLVAAKGTWQERFVCLFPAPPAVPTALRWSSDVRGRKLSRRSTSVPLTEVLRIGFGDEQLPASIRMKVKPWHCFSLWTAKRSFLFWAPQAETAEAFIVGLSRLCKHLSFGQGSMRLCKGQCRPTRKFSSGPPWHQLLVESRWMTLRLTTVVALARASQAAYFPGPAEHLWIDADPSGLVWTGLDCDDDLALLAALALNASAEIHLEGLSICGGNATWQHENRVCATAELFSELASVLTWKGEDSDAAAKAIIAAAAAAPPSLTILMLGPVTNLARALVLAPWLAQRLRHAVLMGGELTGQRLDLNFMTDRAAARAVISNALLPTTLVPIQTCAQVTVTPAFVERLERTCCPGAGVCAVGPKMWQQTFVMPWMVNRRGCCRKGVGWPARAWTRASSPGTWLPCSQLFDPHSSRTGNTWLSSCPRVKEGSRATAP
ncbi:unnamed protein product [Polarella glacialis]|uniref:PH domain-containing protein n=1 Tax=Polarella glacialis TaxID=89957 RepID=A0A813FX40_POLGL|nr:unnamed protein product [Polarella glacialis]